MENMQNITYNILFTILKLLFFLAILKQIKTKNNKYALIQIIAYFVFDFIFLSSFYNLK